jgi:hypothetical protein
MSPPAALRLARPPSGAGCRSHLSPILDMSAVQTTADCGSNNCGLWTQVVVLRVQALWALHRLNGPSFSRARRRVWRRAAGRDSSLSVRMRCHLIAAVKKVSLSLDRTTMRPHVTPTAASLLPEAGTTEAIERGCTCRSIGHWSATDELEPAGMLLVPDANCPLHGTATRSSGAVPFY